jgi:hypothetical protein
MNNTRNVNVIRKLGTVSSPIVKESNKYKNRESPIYFDMNTIDSLVVEQYLLILPVIPGPVDIKKTSLATVHRICCNQLMENEEAFIKNKDFFPLVKRMYSLILRVTSLNRFTYAVNALQDIRLPLTLNGKIMGMMSYNQINIENLLIKNTSFPSQEQTISLIDKLSREITKEINQYIMDIWCHLQTLNIVQLRNLDSFIIDNLFPEYEAKSSEWEDIDYLYYMLHVGAAKGKRRSLSQSLDDMQVKQLLGYIADLHLQMYMIYIPYRLIEHKLSDIEGIAETIANCLKDYKAVDHVTKSIIKLNPQMFGDKLGNKISNSQYKNILLMLENVVRSLSIGCIKTYGSNLMPRITMRETLRIRLLKEV